MTRVKILIVGLGLWPWYEEACQKALVTAGHDVRRVGYADYFYDRSKGTIEIVYRSLSARVQNRLLSGPLLWKVNFEVLQAVDRFRPEIVWFFNATHMLPLTAKIIRRRHPSLTMVQYANDNPFTYGSHVRPDYYRHFKRSIPLCHTHYVYRASNIGDFKARGATSVDVLRSYFIPGEDERIRLGGNDRSYHCDLVFAGHYEADDRLSALDALARQGLKVNIFGPEWHRGQHLLAVDSPLLRNFPVKRVLGDDYRKAISGSKIALSFLSKINTDTYTRRNFQIPAMGAFMLSEYSEDLATLFTEGTDVEYFRSVDELVDKAKYYLKHEDARERIARKGYERVWSDGHDVGSRMRWFIQQVLNSRT